MAENTQDPIATPEANEQDPRTPVPDATLKDVSGGLIIDTFQKTVVIADGHNHDHGHGHSPLKHKGLIR